VLPDYRENGIATQLVKSLARESPHDKIVAKCPAELPANDFYATTGWVKTHTETGKKRALNVWQYDINTVDLITTGRDDLISHAEKYGWLTGTRLDDIARHERGETDIQFIDVHWEDPDRETLLAKCMTHKPKYVVAGDYDGDNYQTVNEYADTLRQYADNVIIVPHEPGEVSKVPEWAVVGYSTPTNYAGTDAPIWEYTGRDIHVLGGTMNQIKIVVDHLRNDIVSIDTNTMHRDATQYGEYWTGSKPNRRKTATTLPIVHQTYQNSILNMTYAFEQWGLI